jgi:hypothetical protein
MKVSWLFGTVTYGTYYVKSLFHFLFRHPDDFSPVRSAPMKACLIILCAFIAISQGTSNAQVIANPVSDFLQRHADAETGALFAETPWDGFTGSEPPGGYLLRFEANVGGYGSPILFLGSSLFFDERYTEWTAYIHVDDTHYQFAADRVSFGYYPSFYLLSPKVNGMQGLAVVITGKTGFGVATYVVTKSGHLREGSLKGMDRDQDKEDSDPQFESEEATALEKQDQLHGEIFPKVEQILLTEYLRRPSMAWGLSDRTYGPAQQAAKPAANPATRSATIDRKTASAIWRKLRQ